MRANSCLCMHSLKDTTWSCQICEHMHLHLLYFSSSSRTCLTYVAFHYAAWFCWISSLNATVSRRTRLQGIRGTRKHTCTLIRLQGIGQAHTCCDTLWFAIINAFQHLGHPCCAQGLLHHTLDTGVCKAWLYTWCMCTGPSIFPAPHLIWMPLFLQPCSDTLKCTYYRLMARLLCNACCPCRHWIRTSLWILVRSQAALSWPTRWGEFSSSQITT